MIITEQSRIASAEVVQNDPVFLVQESDRPRSDSDPHAEQHTTVLSAEAKEAAARLSPHPGLENLPTLSQQPFVGRTEALARLAASLTEGGGVITQPSATTVSGLGGIGKTALALHYAHKHRAQYTLVWWITAESEEQISSGLADLTLTLYPDWARRVPLKERTEWALTWLETHPGWLLVYDNVERPEHLTPFLGRLLGRGHQVVTSRCRTGWPDETELISLDVLNHEAAVDLLCVPGTGQGDAASGERAPGDRSQAELLAAELGHLPLALAQARAYLRETRTGFAAYRAKLLDAAAEAAGVGDSAAARAIARICRTSLEAIRARHPLAVSMLHTLAWYAPEALPPVVLEHMDSSAEETESALQALTSYHLVSLEPDGIALHRLLQRTLREQAPEHLPDARGRAERALAAAVTAAPDGVAPFLIHIQALAATEAAQDAGADAELALMYRQGADELIAREQHVLAIPLLQRVVECDTRLRGIDLDSSEG
ncbi:hypothetical protein [Streptomyces sp. NPDC001978]|uniref:hypothetical protein n=1 Tax=Streptomyces sp. NPDC001978 TaxID=3364627 RepID=UPI0036936D17